MLTSANHVEIQSPIRRVSAEIVLVVHESERINLRLISDSLGLDNVNPMARPAVIAVEQIPHVLNLRVF